MVGQTFGLVSWTRSHYLLSKENRFVSHEHPKVSTLRKMQGDARGSFWIPSAKSTWLWKITIVYGKTISMSMASIANSWCRIPLYYLPHDATQMSHWVAVMFTNSASPPRLGRLGSGWTSEKSCVKLCVSCWIMLGWIMLDQVGSCWTRSLKIFSNHVGPLLWRLFVLKFGL